MLSLLANSLLLAICVVGTFLELLLVLFKKHIELNLIPTIIIQETQSMSTLSYESPSNLKQSNLNSVEARKYTKYTDRQCRGTGDDILIDYFGTAEECKRKCDELDCIGFVRVNSGSELGHDGQCFFRSGEMNKPFYQGIDNRDCYLPGIRFHLYHIDVIVHVIVM